MLLSGLLASSEVTRGESTLESRDAQDVGWVKRRKSWVDLLPTSILGGCGMVSNMDIEKVAGLHVTVGWIDAVAMGQQVVLGSACDARKYLCSSG